MLKQFYPHAYAESVFVIDYEALYRKGYRGLIFDIDNTLVPHGADSTPAVDALFRDVQRIGFRTLLLSNNNRARIERFLKNIDSPYICDADKPRPAGYRRALDMLRLGREEVLVIGDQVFTDILGANRSGLDSILVEFIGAKYETKIGKRRTLEKALLWFYRRSRSCRNRLGDILKGETSYALE